MMTMNAIVCIEIFNERNEISCHSRMVLLRKEVCICRLRRGRFNGEVIRERVSAFFPTHTTFIPTSMEWKLVHITIIE